MPAPKLQPGQKDGRSTNRRPPKTGIVRDKRLSVRLTEEEHAWVLLNGGSEWIVEQIKRGMGEGL